MSLPPVSGKENRYLLNTSSRLGGSPSRSVRCREEKEHLPLSGQRNRYSDSLRAGKPGIEEPIPVAERSKARVCV